MAPGGDPRTILVTGAAGFIGSHLCEALLADGRRVIGLDNFDDFYDPARKRRNLTSSLAHPGFSLVEADIRDAAAVEGVMGEADLVVHLAAKAG
ncbi:MAG: NAD-dependent epimerase/dehydratase family protein, partial [Planctomycetota bacterium]